MSTAALEPAPAATAEPVPTATAIDAATDPAPTAPAGNTGQPSSRKRKAFAGCPPTAGSLGYAQFWWYRDHSGTDQGPFDTGTMRAWFVAGHLPAETLVAASYYGEVPHDLWVVAELWETPQVRPPLLVVKRLAVHVAHPRAFRMCVTGGGFCRGARRGVCAEDRSTAGLYR